MTEEQWTVKTLKEYFERQLKDFERLQREKEQSLNRLWDEKERALELQAREYERRLEGLNNEYARLDKIHANKVSYSVLVTIISLAIALISVFIAFHHY